MNLTKFFKENYIAILFIIIVSVVLNTFSLQRGMHHMELDDSISCEVSFSDGTIKTYNSNLFPTIDKGEKVVATIPIPDDSGLLNPAICFHIYNCTFELKYKDEFLFSAGEDLKAKHAFIGNHYGSVVLPKEVMGEEITLTCVATENSATGQLTDVFLMEATDVDKYPLMGHEAMFLIFMTICMAAFFVLIYSLLHGLFSRLNRLVIWVSLLAFLFSLYVLSSGGLLNVLFYDERICANAEYLTVFALPIPISLYFLDIVKGKRLKKIMRGMSAFYILYYVIAGILNYTTKNIHYNLFLTPLHVFMVLGIVVYLTIPYLKISGEKDYGRSQSLMTGTFILLVVCLYDLARFQLNQIMTVLIYKKTLIPYGVLAMIAFMVKNVYQEHQTNLSELHRKNYLESLAYQDALSGLMSRAKFDEYVDDMRKNGIKEFSVLFIDLNNLKFVNDNYGHDEGDLFIRTFSNVLEKNFYNSDIISRFGGDEFVVIYTKNLTNRIKEILEEFRKDMEYINKQKRYKFTLSAAVGYTISTQDNPYDIDTAIKLADERMYEDKRIYKESIRQKADQ